MKRELQKYSIRILLFLMTSFAGIHAQISVTISGPTSAQVNEITNYSAVVNIDPGDGPSPFRGSAPETFTGTWSVISGGTIEVYSNTAVKIKSWDDEKWVYVDIQDNGVGIPKEDLEHIFDKFYRVKNDASHSIKGTGLGLYLVKYFVELHGGTIDAQSTLGQGTKFTVKLRNQ